MRKFYPCLIQLTGDVVVADNWKIMQVDMCNLKLLSKNRTKEKLLALEEEVPLCILMRASFINWTYAPL